MLWWVRLSALALEYLDGKGVLSKYNISNIPRHHPELIKCVEKFGAKANGEFSNLIILSVAGKYRIEEYDGFEQLIIPTFEWVWNDPEVY